ncbi:hypothetical protein V7111_21180 [Neobacillus niacini]
MKNNELKETPHIKPNGVEIAETILLPGDPLRAKFIADETATEKWAKMGILAEEMETTSLYLNAASAGAKALTILTVSDHMITHEQTTQEERQTSFTKMMEIALELV